MELIFNRTKRYLLPILNNYPKIFKDELQKVHFNLFVGDVDYYRTRQFESNLFIVIPFKQTLINACRAIKWYKQEYPLNLTDKYVIVIDIPPEYKDSYENFLLGRYSKMYTSRQIKELGFPQILNGDINLTYCVLTHNAMAYEDYKRVLREVYHTNQYPIEPEEYDVPPRIPQEFLNFRGNEDFIKSICPLRNL